MSDTQEDPLLESIYIENSARIRDIIIREIKRFYNLYLACIGNWRKEKYNPKQYYIEHSDTGYKFFFKKKDFSRLAMVKKDGRYLSVCLSDEDFKKVSSLWRDSYKESEHRQKRINAAYWAAELMNKA